MVENAIKKQQETGAVVYLQHCGALHLFGQKGVGLLGLDGRRPYDQSLVYFFTRAGKAVLPVLPKTSMLSLSNLSPKARKAFDNFIVVFGLSEKKAYLNDGEELDFLSKVLQHSGMKEFEIVKGSLQERRRAAVEAKIPQWFAEAEQRAIKEKMAAHS